MKLLWRALGLLLGLVYRLIVLALFERWIPFPQREPAQPAARPRRARSAARPPPLPVRPQRARVEPAPLFEPRSGEPPVEQVAALESEHLHVFHARAGRGLRGPPARPLRALLTDKRALASAVVLGEALRRRRSL